MLWYLTYDRHQPDDDEGIEGDKDERDEEGQWINHEPLGAPIIRD